MIDIAATCLAITALLTYVNHRFVGLPTTIGVMATALVLSMGVVGLDMVGLAYGLREAEEAFVRSIDFNDVLLEGMLSVLLFAGALHVNLSELRAYRWPILLLAVVSTLASALLIGFTMWLALPLLGLTLALPYCLLFGALISPTDPVAVMGILKSSGAPKNLEVVITGESLFNDGVGVVLFSLGLGVVALGTLPSAGDGLLTFLHEAGGGLAFGWLLGYVTYWLMKSVDQYQLEVLLTLAAVIGGYALAAHLHVSGPLAMVAAGLMIGSRGRAEAMSQVTRKYVDMFWELLDEILNAVLFVLVGMEVLLIPFPGQMLLAGAVAILTTLLSRSLTVGLPVAIFGRVIRLPQGSAQILTWGGLRGGISVALALSIPVSPAADIVLSLTYCVVVFSILAQGLTLSRVVHSALGGSNAQC